MVVNRSSSTVDGRRCKAAAGSANDAIIWLRVMVLPFKFQVSARQGVKRSANQNRDDWKELNQNLSTAVLSIAWACESEKLKRWLSALVVSHGSLNKSRCTATNQLCKTLMVVGDRKSNIWQSLLQNAVIGFTYVLTTSR